MVDFESDSTITRPADDICKVVILQRRYEYQEEMKLVYERRANGSSLNMNRAKSLLRTLAQEINSLFKNLVDDWDVLVGNILIVNNLEDLDAIFDVLDSKLYEIGLTKIDNKRKLGGNIKERNKAQGWKA